MSPTLPQSIPTGQPEATGQNSQGGKNKPPSPEELNYRPSTDPNQSCATCANMQPDGSCTVLQMKVDPAMICDAYMDKGDTMSNEGRAQMEDQIFGGPNGGAV